MQIVTTNVVINASFGLVDDAGDVAENFPVQLTLPGLKANYFNAAFNQLLDAKQKLIADKIPVAPAMPVDQNAEL